MMMKPAMILGAALLLVLSGCERGVLPPLIELKNLRVEDGPVWPLLHMDVENVSAKTVQEFEQ